MQIATVEKRRGNGRRSSGPIGNIQPYFIWLNKYLVAELGLTPGMHYEIIDPEIEGHPNTYALVACNPDSGPMLVGNDRQGYRLGCMNGSTFVMRGRLFGDKGKGRQKARVVPVRVGDAVLLKAIPWT